MQLQRSALAFALVDQCNSPAHVATALTREGTADVPLARAGEYHWRAVTVLQANLGTIPAAEGQVHTTLTRTPVTGRWSPCTDTAASGTAWERC